mmetsp:Transcript_72934/g.159421  ORF Transcript_72934/g.159421 Transcript_72934/m.159421 type:complete len:252 (-) Transcript_72934:16-771(-)
MLQLLLPPLRPRRSRLQLLLRLLLQSSCVAAATSAAVDAWVDGSVEAVDALLPACATLFQRPQLASTDFPLQGLPQLLDIGSNLLQREPHFYALFWVCLQMGRGLGSSSLQRADCIPKLPQVARLSEACRFAKPLQLFQLKLRFVVLALELLQRALEVGCLRFASGQFRVDAAGGCPRRGSRKSRTAFERLLLQPRLHVEQLRFEPRQVRLQRLGRASNSRATLERRHRWCQRRREVVVLLGLLLLLLLLL